MNKWTSTPDPRHAVPEQRNGPPEFYADREDWHGEGAALIDIVAVLVAILIVAAVVVAKW